MNDLCGNFVLFDPRMARSRLTPTIYIGTSEGVQRSADAGATFTLMPGSPAQATRVDIHSSGILYVTAGNPWTGKPNGGVFKWSNNAWTTISPPTPGTYSAIAVNPQNKDQVVVSSSSFSRIKFDHFRSKDGGATWSPMNKAHDKTEAPWYDSSIGQATSTFCWDPFKPATVWFTDFFFAYQTTDIWAEPKVTWKSQCAGHEETVAIGNLLCSGLRPQRPAFLGRRHRRLGPQVPRRTACRGHDEILSPHLDQDHQRQRQHDRRGRAGKQPELHRPRRSSRIQELVENIPNLAVLVEPLLIVRRVLREQIVILHRRLLAIVREDEVCRRLMTTPGVGPVVALTYRATVDVPARFRKSKSVGAVFGLTCSRYQSGEIDWSGKISRCGDEMMRTMLYEAAQSMMHSKKWSWLKAWAMQIARRRGMKKAIVALARRLAVIMHRIWVDGTEFCWTREQATAAA